MDRVLIISTVAAVCNAGSCYYFYYFRDHPLSDYRYCLAGCCGPKVADGINVCCSSTGATIGIVAALVILIAIVAGVCMAYRRKCICVPYRTHNQWLWQTPETGRLIVSSTTHAGGDNGRSYPTRFSQNSAYSNI